MELAVASALDAWKATDCTAVEPYFAGWTADEPASKDGVNTIAWIGDWAERGYPTQSPGYTDMQYRGHDGIWEIADADIYLDAGGYEWTIERDHDTSIEAVLTHELGHALGLLHPCELDHTADAPDCSESNADQQATTMYPLYSAAQASPATDDLSGICYLYPVEGACSPGCGPQTNCIEGECRALCGDALCQVGDVCGYWGCSPRNGCTERSCTGHVCDTHVSCGPLARCNRGVCVTGEVPWGSACKGSNDCQDGACVDHVCQPTCRTDTECRTGTCMAALDGHARGCVASRDYVTGARCTAGEDCTTGLCLFTATPAVCTVECRSKSACPEDWSCRGVDGRDVCVPADYQPAGGGCSLGAPPTRGSDAGLWILGSIAVTRAARARIRRRHSTRAAGR